MIVPCTEVKLIVAVNWVHVIENVDTKTLCIITGWLSYFERKSSGPIIHLQPMMLNPKHLANALSPLQSYGLPEMVPWWCKQRCKFLYDWYKRIETNDFGSMEKAAGRCLSFQI